MTTPRTVAEWAEHVLAEVRRDVARGQMPRTVTSFAELHDHVDANDYVLDIPDLPNGDPDFDTIIAVQDAVDEAIKNGALRTDSNEAQTAVTYPDVFVKLSGSDGNVFGIIGTVRAAIKRAHGADAAKTFTDAAFAASSYSDVLALCMRTVNAS